MLNFSPVGQKKKKKNRIKINKNTYIWGKYF